MIRGVIVKSWEKLQLEPRLKAFTFTFTLFSVYRSAAMSTPQSKLQDQSVQTEDDSAEAVIELIQHYCDKLLDIIKKTMSNEDIVLSTRLHSKLRIIYDKIHEFDNHYTQNCEQGELKIICLIWMLMVVMQLLLPLTTQFIVLSLL